MGHGCTVTYQTWRKNCKRQLQASVRQERTQKIIVPVHLITKENIDKCSIEGGSDEQKAQCALFLSGLDLGDVFGNHVLLIDVSFSTKYIIEKGLSCYLLEKASVVPTSPVKLYFCQRQRLRCWFS